MFWQVFFGILAALAVWSGRRQILAVLDWMAGASLYVIGKAWPILLVAAILVGTYFIVINTN